MSEVCCFFGHRDLPETEKLKTKLYSAIEDLIINKNVRTFLFGSKSRFNDICYETVTEIKSNYPDIKRIYVRAEYPQIDSEYKAYLLRRYEDTFFPEKLYGAGRAVYIKRNLAMIENSRYCIVYYRKKTAERLKKSGTETAYRYAAEKKKEIILI